MKFAAALLLLAGLAYSFPQNTAGRPQAVASSFPGLGVRGNPFGPKAFGPGLNNPLSIPPNPFEIQRALAVARRFPGVLARVDVDGDVTLTDQFGRDLDGDSFNFIDPTGLLDF